MAVFLTRTSGVDRTWRRRSIPRSDSIRSWRRRTWRVSRCYSQLSAISRRGSWPCWQQLNPNVGHRNWRVIQPSRSRRPRGPELARALKSIRQVLPQLDGHSDDEPVGYDDYAADTRVRRTRGGSVISWEGSPGGGATGDRLMAQEGAALAAGQTQAMLSALKVTPRRGGQIPIALHEHPFMIRSIITPPTTLPASARSKASADAQVVERIGGLGLPPVSALHARRHA